jgi:hypothetical protein
MIASIRFRSVNLSAVSTRGEMGASAVPARARTHARCGRRSDRVDA